MPDSGGWRLGKYPVTVEEYQRFVEHRGYEELKHWNVEGWAAREEEGWEAPGKWDEQLTAPNRPVIDVSWHEAQAYCTWLSEQREEEIRLPSEELWAAAATPEKGEYPWGEAEPDEERANFSRKLFEPNVGSPTPVGVYPAGNGRFGHCDLGGNVWEWCSDAEGGVLVLRGGYWYYPAENLRAADRLRGGASGRSVDAGFRLAAAPPSLDS